MSQVKKKSKKDDIFYACVKGEFEELLAAIEEANSRDETKLFTWPYQTHPLHFAAAYGDLDVVRTLIEKYNYDAECRNSEGVTPLHFASLGGHAHVVDYLLKERQCDPNVLDRQNASPLHYVCYSTYDNLKQHQRKLKRRSSKYYYSRVASHNDSTNFYTEMLTRVCLVESAERMYYNTAMKLHYSRGQISIARNLMLHEGSPLAETSSNQQPMLLELACQCGSLEDLQYFIDMCALPDSEAIDVQTKLVTSLLCIACNYEQVEIFAFLVKNYVSQGMKLPNGYSILMLACAVGNLAIIKCIVELNVVSVTLELINEVADNKANYCILKLLVENLEKPTSLTEDSNMPYQQFIPRISNPNSNTFKLLQAALTTNNFELLRAVINESTITSKDGDGNTPLHWMCMHRPMTLYCNSNFQFLKYLLSLVDNDLNLSGANIANHKGELPLHIVFSNTKLNVDIVRLVSPRHDKINAQDHDGNTALHVACMKNVSVEIIQYLVKELGINPSCQNNKRELPLHIFCKIHCGPRDYYRTHSEPHKNPDNEIVVKLLSSQPKFDIDIRDISDQTPLHIVCRNIENVEIVRYLTQEKKCDQNIQNSKHQLALHIVSDLEEYSGYYHTAESDPLPILMEMAKLVSGHPTFNVNAQDEKGNTPLHIACRNENSFELIQYLVKDKQCDQSIRNKCGELPLHVILDQLSWYTNDEHLLIIVKASKLVSGQSNLNIDAQDQDGNTPVHIACKYKNFELIRYLTQEKECNHNIQNSEGRLPLHIIIEEMGTRDDCTLVSMVRFVCSQTELNIHAQDKNGDTPLHIACKFEAKEVVKYLVFEKNCIPAEHSDSKLYSNLIIHVACIEKDDISMLRLLATKDNINNQHHKSDWRHTDRSTSTPLHVACENKNVAAVKLLLQLGCDLNVKNGKGELPLHIACQKGLLTFVELVADCDVNSIDQDGQTPLHIACFWKHFMLVKFLIENKHANPHLQARNGDTILHSACRSGATEIVRYLNESDICDHSNMNQMLTKLNEQKQYPFHIACTKSLELVKMTTPNFTTEQLISTVDEDFNCLHLASSHGLVDVVEYLVEQGCSPFTEDKYGINALGSACGLREYSLKLQPSNSYNYFFARAHEKHICPKVVKYLVAKCFLDPTKPQSYRGYAAAVIKCSSLFEHACQLKNLELMKALTCTVANVNSTDSNGNTPLHIACKFGHVEMVEYLVQQGCNQRIQNNESELALHLAASKSVEIVKLLDQSDPDVQRSYGDTALHIACHNNKEQIVTHLVQQRRCHTNIKNSAGELPIHVACRSSKDSNIILRCLMDANHSDIFVRNGAGKLPLHIASEFGSIKHIEILSNPKSIDEIDFDGNTALHLACKGTDLHVIEWLIEHGAKYDTQNKKGNTPAHLCIEHSHQFQVFEHIIPKALEHLYKDRNDPALLNLVGLYSIARPLIASCSLIQNSNGDLPIHLACRLKTFEIMIIHAHVLLLSEEDTFEDSLLVQNTQGDTPLHIALRTITRPLIELIPSCTQLIQNNDGDLPIHIACRVKNDNIINHLSKQDTFKNSLLVQNAQGDTPLHIALRTITRPLIELIPSCTKLIQNNDGDLPIHIACRVKNDEIINHLSKQDTFENSLVVQNAQGDTPLHSALQARATSTDILKLVTTSANCNAQNKLGNTALHLICISRTFHHNNYSVYKRHLFELGCDIHLVNSNGQLPLHIAVMHSWTGKTFLNMLLDPIEMITYQDKAGNTPLHLACQRVMVYRNEDSETTCKYLVAKLKDCSKKERISGVSTSSNLLAAINQGNAEGDTPLHLAVQSGDEKLVRYLVNCKFCNLTKQNKYGQTALHIACSKSSLKMVQMVCSSIDIGSSDLFSQVNVNVDFPEDSGHIFPGDTPLHIACRVGHGSIVKYLIKKHPDSSEAAMAIPNTQNELPIHLCCSRSRSYSTSEHESLLKLITKFSKMFANSQTQSKDTVLHIVCKFPYCSTILTYLVKTIHCDVTIPNCDGDLPLHLICRNTGFNDLLSSLKVIINAIQNNSAITCNAKNNDGNTPLHEVCKRQFHTNSYAYDYDDNRTKYMYNIMQEVVEYLLDQGCDKELSNNDQETCLHLACQYQTLSVVKLLLHRGVLSVSKEGNSVLHYACLNETRNYETNNSYAYDIVCHLAVETPKLFDRLVHNCNKETPLHFACKNNNFEVVKCLLSKGADVSHADIHGQTPITLATDPSIIRLLLEHGADPTHLYDIYKNLFQYTTSSGAPPPTPLKILFIGDPGAGKTTLVESLKNEDSGNMRQLQTKTFGHTAGVIPNDFSSQEFGEVTMYDFAGHSEYYSSHGGVIHSIIKNSPPVIMVLVNLTKDISEIRERALYWTKFVLNYCASLEGKPHLLLLGSHADVLKENGQNPKAKTKDLIKIIEEKISTNTIVVKSALSINCTQSQSLEINKLRQQLQESASELKEKTVLKFSSHCLYVFMQQHFRDQPAIRLDYLLSTLSRQSSLNQELQSASRDKNSTSIIGFLPTDLEKVAQMCEELSERGHVLFIKHPQIKQSWIILKKDILLHEVVGRLFAPADFPEHIQSLANSNGVVPFSKLKLLPYDPNLLTGFLTHMEYCKEILDQETLQLLNHESSSDSSVQYSQMFDEIKYFFFPSLVSVERPCEVWKLDKPNFTYQCGLILECDLEQEDFFNPQFIQVLLLRLAFTYAVKPTRKKRREYGDGVRVHDIVEKRVCTVWKSGLHWLERSGIETLVDVIDNNKILILMQCLDNVKVKCLKRRSEILSTIMTTKMKLCPNPQITSYLLNPKRIQHPLPPLSEVSLFTMDDINATIRDSEGTLIINDNGDCLEQNELLFFEPYAHLCQSIVDCLFNRDSSALEEVVSDDFLHHVCHHLSPCYDHVVELISKHITQSGHMSASVSSSLSITTEKLFQMFEIWQRRQPQNSGGTYLELRSVFNEVSLFPSLDLTPTGACCDNYHGISEVTPHGHLSITDLRIVREAIWDIRVQWYDLGVQLHLDPPSLGVIKVDCREMVDSCFNKMLESWLERAEPQPTWSALVEAIESPVICNPRLAQELREKYM